MKILICVVHFFGHSPSFAGGSAHRHKGDATNHEALRERREKFVRRTCEIRDEMQRNGLTVDLRICGIEGKNIVPIDWDFSSISDPTFLVYESLQRMADESDDYDFVICMEDDIILPWQTFQSVLAFEEHSLDNEILHPNRMELNAEGQRYCVDLKALPGWTHNERIVQGIKFGQAVNPHSGICIFSRRKIRYARDHANLAQRGLVVGGRMASAFANLHRPFLLWRSKDDHNFHHVIHQDNWQPALMQQRGLRDRVMSIFRKH